MDFTLWATTLLCGILIGWFSIAGVIFLWSLQDSKIPAPVDINRPKIPGQRVGENPFNQDPK